MYKLTTFLLLGVMFFAAACKEKTAGASTTTFDIEKAKAEIKVVDDNFSSAFLKGDSTGMTALYTADAMLQPPNYPAVDKANMTAYWGGGIRMYQLKELKLNSTGAWGDEKMVVTTGTYELKAGDGSTDKGKTMVIWKKEDGKWKMFRDTWNSDMPPMPEK